MPVIAARFRLCLLAGALLVGACTSDDEPSASTVAPDETTVPESTTTEATTTTTEDPAAAVEQAFFDQWDAFVEVLEDPDPSNPLIDMFFIGAARDSLLDTVSSDIDNGWVTQRPENPDHFKPGVESVEIVDSATAIVIECTIDGLVVVERQSGTVVNDNVVSARLENTFVLDGDQWKLSTNRTLSREEGPDGCD